MSTLVQARARLRRESCSTKKQSRSPAGKRRNGAKPRSRAMAAGEFIGDASVENLVQVAGNLTGGGNPGSLGKAARVDRFSRGCLEGTLRHRWNGDRLPYLASVARRRRAELPNVLSAKLGRALIAYCERHVGRSMHAGKQKLARLLQPELFLILERLAHPTGR